MIQTYDKAASIGITLNKTKHRTKTEYKLAQTYKLNLIIILTLKIIFYYKIIETFLESKACPMPVFFIRKVVIFCQKMVIVFTMDITICRCEPINRQKTILYNKTRNLLYFIYSRDNPPTIEANLPCS